MYKYHIAVLEDSEGNRQSVMTHDERKFHDEKSGLEAQGYTVTQYFETSEKALYTKMRCKVYVSELRDVEKKRLKHMAEIQNYAETGTRGEQLLSDIEKLYEELQETLVNKIGMSYARFLRANEDEAYAYNDELAIQCYNYRQSKMRINSQLAKTTYDGSYDC